jgi:hypothetical protein
MQLTGIYFADHQQNNLRGGTAIKMILRKNKYWSFVRGLYVKML